jgi:hypothetical protein
MKKSKLILLLLSCGVLAGAIVFGIVLLQPQLRPQPHIQCEAMRPFISFNSVDYVNPSQTELAHPPSVNDLGSVVGTAGEGPHNVRYDCGLLSPGEQVYRFKDYRSSFRLAVRTSNGMFFFEVGHNPHARTGSDLFDIGGKVQFITVSPIDNLDSPTHTIHNPANVLKLVNEILTAPVATQCSFGGKEEALLFHLQDGSVVQLSYWPSGAWLSTDWPQCVQLPQDFAARLSQSN